LPSPAHLARADSRLRKLALSYPETVEEFPWGHATAKVRGKSFAFIVLDGDTFSISVKLPDSNVTALMLPFAEPTGYGLGRSGWVTARFRGKEKVPVELLEEWVDESYRAIAPKRLVATLGGKKSPC
jgi:predicted DNA-binding protein (MmcQ/YjbR family)